MVKVKLKSGNETLYIEVSNYLKANSVEGSKISSDNFKYLSAVI